MKNKKVTAIDVAKLAGVSQPTVSRVFSSEGQSVSAEKRKRVEEAAKLLGYQPNVFAQSLITNKTRIIGIVMTNLHNPFYPEVLSLFYEKLSKKGYHVLFISSASDSIEEQEIHQFIKYHVEAVIVTDALLTSSAAELFERQNTPVIYFNRYSRNSRNHAVICDNYNAAFQIGNYLVESGHRNICYISGPENTSTTEDRRKGFLDSLRKNKLKPTVIVNGNYDAEESYRVAKQVLLEHPTIDSLFCGNDISAFGAMKAVTDLGKRIPEDISVVGFDDIRMARWPLYNLTTWKQPMEEMVEETINIMLDHIGNKLDSPTTKLIPGELIVRNSVKNRSSVD
ncbi:LacI family transcriptional regulator [Peribacillus cavernae]|uniref:LacI family transcriptional regulator n=2 Tax=Peribacillus cavernae TaxID=1674310 RepID=A0A433HMQ4_9BACI|nr:LacI family transcriptional regulator [Peribacillus cavernae]